VLNTLTSKTGQRTYDHAITEFVEWYCSEPRLAFNRTVVLRYRISLEQKQYAPATINLRLAAVRRIAYEAADSGLLSPELAAGIRRVKGVRRLGVRVGNGLTAEQGKRLLESGSAESLRGKRNSKRRLRALVVLLHRGSNGQRNHSMNETNRKSGRLLDELRADVSYGARPLRRAPTFTVLALLNLGIGIGLNAVLFSIVNGSLFVNLPYPTFVCLRNQTTSFSSACEICNMRDGYSRNVALHRAKGGVNCLSRQIGHIRPVRCRESVKTCEVLQF